MASTASVMAMGSAVVSSSGVFECSTPLVALGKIGVISRVACGGRPGAKRWWNTTGFPCRCMITTSLIEEKANVFSPVSRSGNGSRNDDDNDVLLKTAPKPVLKMRPMEPVRPAGRFVPSNRVDDRKKVMESLGEALDKAEKLENPPARSGDGDSKNGGTVNAGANPARVGNSNTPKTSKSVWRKGSPVASVEKMVKEPPKASKVREEENEKPPLSNVYTRRLGAPAPSPLKPQRQYKPDPTLQTKPSLVPPPVPMPLPVKAPVEKRQPILVDKFAKKKESIVDPLSAQEALAPARPEKMPPSSRNWVERRKKPGDADGPRRRVFSKGDQKIADEEGISGSTNARKGRKWSKASRRAARLQAEKAPEPVRVEILEVVEKGMLTEELAYNLAISEGDILSYLFAKGMKLSQAHTLDKGMVKMVCAEYGVEVIEAEPTKVEDMARKKEVLDENDLDLLEDRPPVITIMGHVDHGKTTLLDYIRKSRVVASEAGGITQGIGAYKVQVPVDGKLQTCVFLDTPGHEAFGAMRARGARVTDIAIIVVAADDGVLPQTNEAIAHAKAAGVPIIVAINKIDKDGANPDKVMQELSSIGLMAEEWGGDVPMVKISALKGQNVDELLETVMLVAEIQELKANPHRNAMGTAIEACLDKAKGAVATLLVQNGTLKKGDLVICGEVFGKIRALFDDQGGRVDEAGPSTAVQVIGLNNVPVAGDEFEVVDSLDIARERANACAERLRIERISEKTGQVKITLSSIATAVSSGKHSGLDRHQLNIILKVDVQGSIEAIKHAIQALPQENVFLKYVLLAPGDVTLSDVDLAIASEAIIFGFNVKASASIKNYADRKNVEIRLYNIIYDLIDELRNAMEGLLEPAEEQISIGSADVQAVFSAGSGRVAGCMVTDGKMVKDCGVRVVRRGKTIYKGKLNSLRRVKEDVKEVAAGLECGIGIQDFPAWEAGDVIEAFTTVKKPRTLEEASAMVTAALKQAGVS